jgi:hypothetical protein
MSKFVVDLNQEPAKATNAQVFSEYQKPKTRGKFAKIAGIFGIGLIVIILVGAIGGYLYWRSFKSTPQYSLALLIDAARRDDQKTVDELIDTDEVVDDFMPQITGKAVELYCRSLPPQTLAKVEKFAVPFMPAVKDKARAELPGVIREKTDKFAQVPFAAIVLGANRYLDIAQNGETAIVKSKIADRPLEVKMRRNGDKWQIIGVKDEQLATNIAQKIGQEIIAVATNKNGAGRAGKTLGVENLQEILKQAEDILK